MADNINAENKTKIVIEPDTSSKSKLYRIALHKLDERINDVTEQLEKLTDEKDIAATRGELLGYYNAKMFLMSAYVAVLESE